MKLTVKLFAESRVAAFKGSDMLLLSRKEIDHIEMNKRAILNELAPAGDFVFYCLVEKVVFRARRGEAPYAKAIEVLLRPFDKDKIIIQKPDY